MAPPTKAPFIDLTSDNEGENIIDLTGSPLPEARHITLKPQQTASEVPSQARNSLPIQSKPSSARFSPAERSQHRRTSLGNPALLPPAKFSPPSASQTRNGTTITLLSQVGGSQSIISNGGLLAEDAEDDDDIIPLNPRVVVEDVEEADDQEEGGPGDRDTPSKRSSRGDQSSQKSFDRSVGTDSPLLTYHRMKRSRINTEISRSQRDESPREVMARRSTSTELQSHVQQLDIDQLEEDLHQFRQRMHDDHAETVKWLLHDAKRASDRRRSAFMDEISPFASMTPVKGTPGLAPDGMTQLKLDTYVSSRID